MKIDEAKRILSACKGCNYLVPGDGFASECTADGKCFNAKIMAIEALNKQAIREKTIDKYRWHDLRKNPDDLPDDEREYWVHGVWGSGKVSEGGCVFKKDDGYFDACWNFNVTAWREIEPFDEEE